MHALAPFRYLFGSQKEAEPGYNLVIDENHVQIRMYNAYLIARLKIEGDEEDQSRETAYMRLLNYVLGRNTRTEKISAMAPLIQEDITTRFNALLSLEVPGGPKKLKAFEVSVVLPTHFNLETAPMPMDPEIKLEKVKPHLTAVVKFSGLCGKHKRERLSKYLSLWLHEKGYTAVSSPRVAKYNPPFTLPFMRRNEIHIDVSKR
jgi:hypothetical protein